MATGKKLVICEKPDIARKMAKILGVPERGAAFENNEWVISSCFGHLTEVVMPGDGIELPWLPEKIQIKPTPDGKQRYDFLVSQINRPDVGLIVNNCDPGREGEVIFGRVYHGSKTKKPWKRMWLTSQTEQGFKDAAKNLKDSAAYEPIYIAGECRAQIDAVWGVNGSRTIFRAIGSVRTPTFGMAAQAFINNRDFVPQPYWEVVSKVGLNAGTYSSKMVDAKGVAVKFEQEQDALAVLKALEGLPAINIKDEFKISKSEPKPLFNGGDLQKEANRKFRFSMDHTLGIQQILYEKFGMLTYPRSDSNTLAEDSVEDTKKIVGEIAGIACYGKLAQDALQQNMVNGSKKKIFDNSGEVDGHWAVIPTGKIRIGETEYGLSEVGMAKIESLLTDEQWLIFDLVVRRTLAAFYPPAEYAVTVRTHECGERLFKTGGRVLQKQGWLAVYGGKEEDDGKKKNEAPQMPALAAGEERSDQVENGTDKLMTKAPPLLTEAALTTAMETAGKVIDDKELAFVMKGMGLGTTATRPGIIKKIKTGTKKRGPDLVNKGNYLIPTEESLQFYLYLQKTYPKALDPVLRAEWESWLREIEKGKMTRAEFMRRAYGEIAEFVTDMQGKGFRSGSGSVGGGESVGACPACGQGELKEQKFSWTCACGFRIYKEIAKKAISQAQLKKLLTKGHTDLIKGFTGSKGQFEAVLALQKDESAQGGMKVAFHFPDNKKGSASGAAKSEARETSLDCPCCKKSKLMDKGTLIACDGCRFTVWREMGGLKVPGQELKKLLTEGRTGLLSFVSKKTGKPYDACLVLNTKDKKIDFEFPKR